MKNIIFILLLTFFKLSHAQDLMGTWYYVERDNFLEVIITKDSIISKDLNPEFELVHKKDIPYVKEVKLKNKRLLVLSKTKNGHINYRAMVITNLMKGQTFQMVWNKIDFKAGSIDSLISIHQKDNRKLHGTMFFHKSYLATLKKRKSIETMTKEDFIKFFKLYHKWINKIEKSFDTESKLSINNHLYDFAIETFYNLGYNPLVTEKMVNKLFKKYEDEPEIKKFKKEL